MRIALIADLHGNMVALEAVAADIARREVDAIYCLGDLVGKGPQSPETMDWALAHCQVALKGNWDETVHDAAKGTVSGPWYRAQLGEERLRQLAALPLEHRFCIAGRKVRLMHGRPLISAIVFSYSELEMRRSLFETADGYVPDIVGFADIHRPFYQHIDGMGILFNTGSVGNPLADQPNASYVLLEGEEGTTPGPLSHTIVQLCYDREEAIRRAECLPDLPSVQAYIRELRTGKYSR